MNRSYAPAIRRPRSWRVPSPMRAGGVAWGASAAGFIALLILYNDALAGVIRYLLALTGTPQLFYVPFIAAIVFVAIYNLVLMARVRSLGLLLILYVLSAMLISLLLERSLSEVLFATYIWTPFFVGFTVAILRQEQRVLGHAGILWLIATIGILINSEIDYPWSGSTYSVLGFEIQASVQWFAWEFERLAGFSRASFAAANQIGVMACFLIAMPGRRIVKAAVWVLSLIAISLTTTKTPLLLIFIAPVAMFVFDALVALRGRGMFAYVYAQTTITAFLLAVALLPLAQGLQAFFDPDVRISFFNFSSIGERLATTWPKAFALIRGDHNPIEWLTGRGIGGIGIPQQFDELIVLNPADNMFVYLYVSLGLLAVPLVVLIYRGWARLYRDDPAFFRMMFLATLCTMVLGTMTNVIESVVPCLLLGMVAGKGFAPSRAPAAIAPPAPPRAAATYRLKRT